jgi:hypothetical protein
MFAKMNDRLNELMMNKTRLENLLKNNKSVMLDEEKLNKDIRKLDLDIQEIQVLITGNVAENIPGKGGAKFDLKKQSKDLINTVNTVARTAAKGSTQQVAADVNSAPSTFEITSTFVWSTFESNLLVDYFSTEMTKEETGNLESAVDKIKITNKKSVSAIKDNKGQVTGAEVETAQTNVNRANTVAQIVTKNKQYKGLTRGQAIMGITFILSIAGLGGYIAYNDAANNDAIDKLTKTILGLNKKNTDGCFLITNTGYSRLDDDCSTWYSTGDNKFSCGCGTLTDTKQAPDCSALKDNDRDCTAPYCLGQATCTNPIDPAKTSKCTVKNNPTQPLYQCTGKDLNDPNFISYAYSDSLPLEPYVTTYLVNKQIYDQYYNSTQYKTLMYVSIGISVLVPDLTSFFSSFTSIYIHIYILHILLVTPALLLVYV